MGPWIKYVVIVDAECAYAKLRCDFSRYRAAAPLGRQGRILFLQDGTDGENLISDMVFPNLTFVKFRKKYLILCFNGKKYFIGSYLFLIFYFFLLYFTGRIPYYDLIITE